MRYTLDRPENSITAFGLQDRFKGPVVVGVLIPLPESSKSTASKFGRYTLGNWDTPPPYACFAAEEGSMVIRWKSNAYSIDISDEDDLERVFQGYLHDTKVLGEFGGNGKVWVVEEERVNA
tara:strand:- start:344 stop:706 length:363 start_codon:yes stop_codon:yes gene_type:complete